MSKPLRIFIAINVRVTPALRKLLENLAGMGRSLKPVSADHLHLTLKFLGDTSLVSVPEICNALSDAVGDQTAFEMPIVGLGVFPHRERPSVIWAGLEQAETLDRIVGELDDRLGSLGYPRESRKYHPHLTLARVRGNPPRELTALVEDHRETRFGIAKVTAVNVYQSELSSEGPRYTVLSSANLKK